MFEPPYVGIDLDDAVENGELNDFAKNIVKQTKSYTEYSPSRTGIHIIAKGTLNSSLKKPFIEAYQNQRYFTVTEKCVYPIYPLREIDLSFLDEYRENRKGPLDLSTKLSNIQEGSRNNDFASIAGSLRNKGYSPEDIFALLEAKARELNFDEKELYNVCRSIGRYPVPTFETGQGVSVDEFLADRQPVEWICKPFIAEQAIGFIAGLPESRKSWMLIDLAIECAKGGGMWLKRFPVKGCKVLLIDQERSKSEVQRRLQSLISGREMSSTSLKDALFVRSGTTTRIDIQHSFDALRKEMADIKPNLVLIDSFATFHTKEESNRMEIQQVLERIKELRNEFKCAIILVHHETKMAHQTRKDGGEPSYLDMSGNVAIPAAAEFTMNVVSHDSESSFCYHTKATQGPKLAPFLIRVIDLTSDKSKICVEAF